jgi:hypothetical protein
MRNEEIVSPEKLRELAQVYSRQSEAGAEIPPKGTITVAFLIVAVCVIGPVLWVTVIR